MNVQAMNIRIVSKSMNRGSRAKLAVRAATEVAGVLGCMVVSWGNTDGNPLRGGKFVSIVRPGNMVDAKRLLDAIQTKWKDARLEKKSANRPLTMQICIPS